MEYAIILLIVLLASLVDSLDLTFMTTVAGTGVTGFSTGVPATAVTFSAPRGVWKDSVGFVYISDGSGYCTKKFSVISDSTVINVAGTCGTSGYNGDGGPATSATMSSTIGISGNRNGALYMCDYGNKRVRVVGGGGTISTFAGTGSNAYAGENVVASSSQVVGPQGIWVNTNGIVYLTGDTGGAVTMISAAGIMTTYAGIPGLSGSGGDGGAATSASFSTLEHLFLDTTGVLFISDTGSSKIRSVTTSGIISTRIGSGTTTFIENVAGTSTGMNSNIGVAGNAFTGDIFVGLRNGNRVIMLTKSSGLVATLAGNGATTPQADSGAATSSAIAGDGTFFDEYLNLYVTDRGGKKVKWIYTQKPTSLPTFIPTAPTISPSFGPTVVPTLQPSVLPTMQPIVPPTFAPTINPSCTPTVIPTIKPSVVPTVVPTVEPTICPSVNPSVIPTVMPTTIPTVIPTVVPSIQPTFSPTIQPTVVPSVQPTIGPTIAPTVVPTIMPTVIPSVQPSCKPTVTPTVLPTALPTVMPTIVPTLLPTVAPTFVPTVGPTVAPTVKPTVIPTVAPSSVPTVVPTIVPSVNPSAMPSVGPSVVPTVVPTDVPSVKPTIVPTTIPSIEPSIKPSVLPSIVPSIDPTVIPSEVPTVQPTVMPTFCPSVMPTIVPTIEPTVAPSVTPTVGPSVEPSVPPSIQPSINPTLEPSISPSRQPTVRPSETPTVLPTVVPSVVPSVSPSIIPTVAPSVEPSEAPTVQPTVTPSVKPTTFPSVVPSECPTIVPTIHPSVVPTTQPTINPTVVPSIEPSYVPTVLPTIRPTIRPTIEPSTAPSIVPTAGPTVEPSVSPTFFPTVFPSVHPTDFPSTSPTIAPSIEPSTSPSICPSRSPSVTPSSEPSTQPSVASSFRPSVMPTAHPTVVPTRYTAKSNGTLPSNDSISVIGSQMDFKIVLSLSVIGSGGRPYSDINLSDHDQGYGLLLPGNKTLKSSVSWERNQIGTYANVYSIDNNKRSASVLRDVSGDGYDDLIIGDPFASKCYLLFGNANGLTNMTTGFTIFGEALSDLTGWSVSGAGDFNNDSINDIIIGAPFAKDVGAVYVIYGRAEAIYDVYLRNLSKSIGFVVYGTQKSDCLGISVSNAGDVNKDGWDDIIAGSLLTTNFLCGSVTVLFGGKQSPESTHLITIDNGITLLGSAFTYTGCSVSGAGDVNRDGFDDILIGNCAATASDSYLVFGGRVTEPIVLLNGLGSSQGVRISRSGSLVSYIGDFNEDGYSDMLFIAVDATESSAGLNEVQGYVISTDVARFTYLSTRSPTVSPTTSRPSYTVTSSPSITFQPTSPTLQPTFKMTIPTFSPTAMPSSPTFAPSVAPSETPTVVPSLTMSPSLAPTVVATLRPSSHRPTIESRSPVFTPTMKPTFTVTDTPTPPPAVREFSLNDGSGVYNVSGITGRIHFVVNATGNIRVVGSNSRTGPCVYTIIPVKNTTLTIESFNKSIDLIDLTAFTYISGYQQLKLSEGSVWITLSIDQFIHILNLHPNDMSEKNFIFYTSIKEEDALTANQILAIKLISGFAGSLICLIAIYMMRKGFLSIKKSYAKLPENLYFMTVKTTTDGRLLDENGVVDEFDFNHIEYSNGSESGYHTGSIPTSSGIVVSVVLQQQSNHDLIDKLEAVVAPQELNKSKSFDSMESWYSNISINELTPEQTIRRVESSKVPYRGEEEAPTLSKERSISFGSIENVVEAYLDKLSVDNEVINQLSNKETVWRTNSIDLDKQELSLVLVERSRLDSYLSSIASSASLVDSVGSSFDHNDDLSSFESIVDDD